MTKVISEELKSQLQDLFTQSKEVKDKINGLLREVAFGEIEDYQLTDWSRQKVPLSSFCNAQGDLLVIQNMGVSCPYCTLWADGLIGLQSHLEDRTGVVMVTPDDSATQKKFAEDRGWKMQMLSSKGTTFKEDLGFADEKGNQMPGVCAFKLKEGKLHNVSWDYFGPGDVYCSVWHMFDLLDEGSDNWQPKFTYE